MARAEQPISATEAAKALGVSTSTITRRAQMGTIPAYKLGRVWMIRPSDLAKIAVIIRRREGA